MTAAGWPELAHADVWFGSPAAADRPPTPGQRATAATLAGDAAEVRRQVYAALAADYPARLAGCGFAPVDTAELAAAGPADTVRLAQVVVWEPPGGGPVVGFDFAWEYDEEGGLGVRWSGGRVAAAGPAEVAHP